MEVKFEGNSSNWFKLTKGARLHFVTILVSYKT
jgi:hypothetical protein